MSLTWGLSVAVRGEPETVPVMAPYDQDQDLSFTAVDVEAVAYRAGELELTSRQLAHLAVWFVLVAICLIGFVAS